ncbi:MAG: hypothetical protein AAGE52_04055 [Myxococcota bacterium]
MKRITWILALGAIAGVACGDDDGGGGVDSGGVDAADRDTGGGTDAGDEDSGTALQLPVVMIGDGPDPTDETGIALDPASAAPANLACFAMGMAPVGGDDVTFQLRIQEFRTDDTLEGLCVKFYDDNAPIPGDTCDPDSDLVTDSDGLVDVTGPSGGWYSYRVFPKDGPSPSLQIAGSVQINEPAPSENRQVEGNSVSQATLDLIPTVLGFRQVPGTALVAGTAFDCDEEPLYGTIVRIFREDGTEVSEGMASQDPHYRYFDGDDFPKRDMPHTHADGIFTVANIPVAADGEFVFVEMWGIRTDGGELELLGCERLPLFADTISIVNMAPIRADAPACPGAS